MYVFIYVRMRTYVYIIAQFELILTFSFAVGVPK